MNTTMTVTTEPYKLPTYRFELKGWKRKTTQLGYEFSQHGGENIISLSTSYDQGRTATAVLVIADVDGPLVHFDCVFKNVSWYEGATEIAKWATLNIARHYLR